MSCLDQTNHPLPPFLSICKQQTTAAAYVLHSGCIKTCPPTVARWTTESCAAAGCSKDQCTLMASGVPHRHAAGVSGLLLAVLATGAALLLGSGGGALSWLW